MADLYLTESGDLAISPNGDLAVTADDWRHLSQQAYLRLMTQIGDFVPYPSLGADLEALLGMPQTADTAQYGINLIKAALNREGVFTGMPVEVKAVPISLQSIRFDIYITTGSLTQMILSIEQDLGLDIEYTGLPAQISTNTPEDLLGE